MDELNRQHLIYVVKEYCGRQIIIFFFFKTSENKKADGLKKWEINLLYCIVFNFYLIVGLLNCNISQLSGADTMFVITNKQKSVKYQKKEHVII